MLREALKPLDRTVQIAFVARIVREAKLFLVGDAGELGKLAANRAALDLEGMRMAVIDALMRKRNLADYTGEDIDDESAEVLDTHVFDSLEQVRKITESWLCEYNEERPDDSLGRALPESRRRPPGTLLRYSSPAMNTPRLVTGTAAALAIALSLPLAAQQLERDVGIVSEEVEGRLEGFSYLEGPVSTLEFKGTAVALAAEGDGRVEFQDGRASVDVSVSRLPDPWKLGPFSTYVMWAVTADGRANNLGSIEVRNGSGSLETSTPLSQFALIVSAEPHFAVTAPSKYMVLRNLGKRIRGTPVQIPGLRERIDYSGLTATPFDPKAKIPLDLAQARYALEIARGAEAHEYAAAEFARAEALLAKAEEAQASKQYRVRNTVPLLARDAVQMGEDARRKAVLGRQAAEREAATLAARQGAEDKARQEAGVAAEQAKQRELLAAEEAGRQAALEADKKARADLTARLNRALPTRQTERGIVAEIAGVQFATGAATLNPVAREALARLAGIVGVYPSLRFKVEGHTDSTGSAETNRNLSLQRAITVRDYLIGQGVDASAINVEGLGPDQPVAENATSEGRARNRRVEIILTGDLVTQT